MDVAAAADANHAGILSALMVYLNIAIRNPPRKKIGGIAMLVFNTPLALFRVPFTRSAKTNK